MQVKTWTCLSTHNFTGKSCRPTSCIPPPLKSVCIKYQLCSFTLSWALQIWDRKLYTKVLPLAVSCILYSVPPSYQGQPGQHVQQSSLVDSQFRQMKCSLGLSRAERGRKRGVNDMWTAELQWQVGCPGYFFIHSFITCASNINILKYNVHHKLDITELLLNIHVKTNSVKVGLIKTSYKYKLCSSLID